MSCCSTEGTCSTGTEAVEVVVDAVAEGDAPVAEADADRVPAQRA
ncbi:hypothetical protein [Kitasatospora purpeofusca]|nr:hypothetical protein OIP63_31995 [Kitasatospora purpeofusca]